MSKCYYCEEEMKDGNLKKHCLTKHSAAKRVLGEQSVFGHFATSAKRSIQSKMTDPSTSSKPDELLLLSGGRKTPDNLFSRPETPDERDPATDVFEDDDEHTDVEDGQLKELIKTVKKIDVNSESSLKEIKLLHESIYALESRLRKKVPEFAKPDDVSPVDE